MKACSLMGFGLVLAVLVCGGVRSVQAEEQAEEQADEVATSQPFFIEDFEGPPAGNGNDCSLQGPPVCNSSAPERCTLIIEGTKPILLKIGCCIITVCHDPCGNVVYRSKTETALENCQRTDSFSP